MARLNEEGGSVTQPKIYVVFRQGNFAIVLNNIELKKVGIAK